MKRLPSPSWLLVPLLAVLSLDARATTLVQLGVSDLSLAADVVVQGTVRRVESRWSGDRRRIITDVQLEVGETLKGEPGRTLTILQPGGRVGDIVQRVDGLASFAEGEEVVVFLERRSAEVFQVRGMAQGKFHVQRPGGGDEPLAVPESLGAARLLDPQRGEPVASRLRTLPLAQLKREVKSALATPPREVK